MGHSVLINPIIQMRKEKDEVTSRCSCSPVFWLPIKCWKQGNSPPVPPPSFWTQGWWRAGSRRTFTVGVMLWPGRGAKPFHTHLSCLLAGVPAPRATSALSWAAALPAQPPPDTPWASRDPLLWYFAALTYLLTLEEMWPFCFPPMR